MWGGGYKKDWQDTFAAFAGPLKFSISDLEIVTVGPVAYSPSIQTVESTGKDGKKSVLVVRVTDIYRKVHGNWLVVQSMYPFRWTWRPGWRTCCRGPNG
jgi:ketosteroid isomerase-like protein